jgi:hypothetical protein
MTGVLLIPLWRRARFWLRAFPDVRHLGVVFRSFSQLKAKTRSWGTTPKDAFAGKWVVFLALEIDSRGDGGSLESVFCFFYATSLSSIPIQEEAWTIVHTASTFYRRYCTETVWLFLMMYTRIL